MVRIILGVVAGFIAWSILWLGGQTIMEMLSPDWIAKHYRAVEAAFATGEKFDGDATIEIINLVRSFITSILSGYMAALVAGEYRRSTLALGILLLIVGIAVEALVWNLAPVWYHLIFIVALIPMTILGGKLRRSS